MKIFKPILISILLMAILSACNLPSKAGSSTQTVAQENLVGTIVAMTMLTHPTRTQTTPVVTSSVPTVTPSPISTRIPPNVPAWSAYNYTCELANGGGTMTMNLAWTDRSDSEDGYKVYRDGAVIATLEPNATFYVDVAFVATGKTLNYKVEAFSKDWQVNTGTITYGCK